MGGRERWENNEAERRFMLGLWLSVYLLHWHQEKKGQHLKNIRYGRNRQSSMSLLPSLLPPFPFFLPRASITYAHVYTWDTLLCKSTCLLFAQQVVNMVGYAMGEIAKPALKKEEEGEEEGGGRTLTRWYPNDSDCYEVVTAWVHPRY